jgi:glycosyltransferase involved in cell wall biosynthesis
MGSIGREGEEKGIDLIWAALTMLVNEGHDICWNHVFGGLQQGHHAELIAERGPHGRVNFYGHESIVEEFLNSLDFFVHVPLRPESESFGLVFLEAIFMQRTCVFTESGELFENDLLRPFFNTVHYNSVEGIASKIRLLMEGSEVEKLPPSRQFEIILSRYSLEKMCESYIQLLGE